MTYATQQDLIDRYDEAELLELADRDMDGVLDQEVIDKALADADDLVNSYVGKRYDLPLAQTPPMLVGIAAEIARFKLYKDDPSDAVAENYKAALRFLKDISNGNAVLDIGGVEPAAAGGTIEVTSSERVFDRDSLKGF